MSLSGHDAWPGAHQKGGGGGNFSTTCFPIDLERPLLRLLCHGGERGRRNHRCNTQIIVAARMGRGGGGGGREQSWG